MRSASSASARPVIVGHGGATFPTHVKIQSGIGKCDTVIINAAECEPYITSDHRLLLERPEEVIGGLKMLADIMGVQNAIIAVEENKSDAFPGIEKLIADDPRLKLYPLKCKYPQGAEKQLINACTGREVPSGKLPADAGCAVFNVDTAGAVYRRFTTGMPVIRRIVTVSGSAIAEPKNLEVRIGTQVEKLIDACGGFKEAPNKLLMGGPMMGVAQFSLEIPIFKGTNAFLAFCGDEDKRVADPQCIRCGKCINALSDAPAAELHEPVRQEGRSGQRARVRRDGLHRMRFVRIRLPGPHPAGRAVPPDQGQDSGQACGGKGKG